MRLRCFALLVFLSFFAVGFSLAAAEASLQETELLRLHAKTNISASALGNLADVAVNDSGIISLTALTSVQFGGRIVVRTLDRELNTMVSATWQPSGAAGGPKVKAVPLDSGELHVFSGLGLPGAYGAKCDFVDAQGQHSTLSLATSPYVPQLAVALPNEHAVGVFSHVTNILVAEVARGEQVWAREFEVAGEFRAATVLKDSRVAVLARETGGATTHLYLLDPMEGSRRIGSVSIDEGQFDSRPYLMAEDGENILIASRQSIWRFSKLGRLRKQFDLPSDDSFQMLHRYSNGTVVAGTIDGRAIRFTADLEPVWVRYFAGLTEPICCPPVPTFLPTPKIEGVRVFVALANYSEVANSSGLIFRDPIKISPGAIRPYRDGYILTLSLSGPVEVTRIESEAALRELPVPHEVTLQVNGVTAMLQSTEPGETPETLLTRSRGTRSLGPGALVDISFFGSPTPLALLGVEGDVVTNSSPVNFSVEGPISLRAVLGAPLRVTVSGEGSVLTDESQGVVRFGSSRIYALPAPGFYFAGWINPSGLELERELEWHTSVVHVTPNTAPSLTAEFKPLPSNATTISSFAYGPGRVIPNHSRPWHEHGDLLELKAVPHPGAVFVGWLEDQEASATNQVVAPSEGSVTRTALFAGVGNGMFAGAFPTHRANKAEILASASAEGPWHVILARTNTGPVLRFEDYAPLKEKRFYRARTVE